MKVIVTGGSGFIGSCFVRDFIESQKGTILNIDKLTYSGNSESLKRIEKSNFYSFEKLDIVNKLKIYEKISTFKPDILINFAAESHVDKSIEDPSEFIYTNIQGTFSLLEASLEYFKKSKNKNFTFYHISTDEVYGDILNDEIAPNESSVYSPNSPYSASKASSDHLVHAWNKTYGLPTIISNCTNNYGPYQHPEKLIPLMIIKAIKGEALPIYGDGKQIRDWLYVEDHIAAINAILEKGERGEKYNISGGNQTSNIEIVKEICQILDNSNNQILKKDLQHSSLISHVEDRPGHDRRYALDSIKLKEELNWLPHYSLDSGLKSTVEWYLENTSWWLNIIEKSNVLDRKGVKKR